MRNTLFSIIIHNYKKLYPLRIGKASKPSNFAVSHLYNNCIARPPRLNGRTC